VLDPAHIEASPRLTVRLGRIPANVPFEPRPFGDLDCQIFDGDLGAGADIDRRIAILTLGGQQKDRIEPILPAIGLGLHQEHLLRQAVRRMGLLRIPKPVERATGAPQGGDPDFCPAELPRLLVPVPGSWTDPPV
jgi:hypothetical protein